MYWGFVTKMHIVQIKIKLLLIKKSGIAIIAEGLAIF